MKLIIDIPEENYESCKRELEYLGEHEVIDTYTFSVAKGIPFDSVIEDIKAGIRQRIDYAETQYGHQLGFDKIYAYTTCLEIIDRHISGKEK